MTASCCDLHTHIVPGVDDGPVTPADALRLLEKLRQNMPEGSIVAATPHYSSAMPEFAAWSRSARACSFAERASDDRLTVICAGELKMGMRRSRIHEVVAYPGTRWVLVEFSQGMLWFGVLKRCIRLLKEGYKPLLAHAERYRWATPARIRFLAGLGSGVSMSLRSLSFSRFRRKAEWILESGMCHLVTSDCHCENDMVLGERARALVENLHPGGWEVLAVSNPRVILDDGALPPLREAGRA